MKVIREEENAFFTLVKVLPWPDEPFAQDVTVLQEKRDDEGRAINRVRVRYGQGLHPSHVAREFAQAILRACDIAERLEQGRELVFED